MSGVIGGSYKEQSRLRLCEVLSQIVDEQRASELASDIASSFGTVDNLFSTPYELLSKRYGDELASFIRVAAAIASRRVTDGYEFGRASGVAQICEYLKAAFADECVESVRVVLLDGNGVPICAKTVSRGVINASDITARSIAEIACSYGSSRVVLAHNHPGGRAEPSASDLGMTVSIANALSSVGIKLEYHVVVSGQECELVVPDEDADL